MAQAQRYKLKLSKLQFCSLVDEPAQPNAKTLLIKRKGNSDEISATGRLAKLNDELGLAFFWAFTTTNADGSDHYDLQGDQVTEFIKAAMDYMTEGQGAVDVMHDGVAGEDRVVFAMPMDPEIGAAYGYVGKQTGLMVVVKPTQENLAKLKSGELNGVSIGGLGERIPVGKRRIAKEAVLTSTDDGHAHTVSLDDPSRYWCDQLQTSYQTSEGASAGHSHAWVFDAKTGAITIADDSGHSHTIAAVVPSDVLAVYAAREAQRDAQNLAEAAAPALIADDPSDGVPMAVAVEESSGSARVVVINARAPQSKSTHTPAVKQAGSHTKEPIMANEHDAKIADLTKRNERLERIAKLNGAHKAHFDTLTGEDAETFLAKSAKDRDAEIAEIEKGNAPIWTGEVTGVAVRKSDGALALQLAKQNEANAVALAKREAEIEKAEVRAQASEILKGMPGDDATHDLIVRSLRKSGAKTEDIEKAFETLKGMRDTSKIGKAAPGIGGEVTTDNPAMDAFNKGLTEFAKAKNTTPVLATNDFIHTTEGAALYAAISA